jgi:hypothetical protein
MMCASDPDQDADPVGPETVQDDLRRLGRAASRVGDEEVWKDLLSVWL